MTASALLLTSSVRTIRTITRPNSTLRSAMMRLLVVLTMQHSPRCLLPTTASQMMQASFIRAVMVPKPSITNMRPKRCMETMATAVQMTKSISDTRMVIMRLLTCEQGMAEMAAEQMPTCATAYKPAMMRRIMVRLREVVRPIYLAIILEYNNYKQYKSQIGQILRLDFLNCGSFTFCFSLVCMNPQSPSSNCSVQLRSMFSFWQGVSRSNLKLLNFLNYLSSDGLDGGGFLSERCFFFLPRLSMYSTAILMISSGRLLLWPLSIYSSLLVPSQDLYSSTTCSLLTNSSLSEVMNSRGHLMFLSISNGFISLMSKPCYYLIFVRMRDNTPVMMKFGRPVMEVPMSLANLHKLAYGESKTQPMMFLCPYQPRQNRTSVRKQVTSRGSHRPAPQNKLSVASVFHLFDHLLEISSFVEAE